MVKRSKEKEKKKTGTPSVFFRFWGCNLECNGFLQKDPTNPDTYELEYKSIELSDIDDINNLPVFKRGCDSSYSWSKRFFHLAKSATALEIANLIREELPYKSFKHPFSKQYHDLIFTGGEPMINQNGIMDIIDALNITGDMPLSITIETNGTQKLNEKFKDFWSKYPNIELFWSVSPKIFNTSGELNSKAIKPEILKQYNSIPNDGQLKFVCNGSDASWDEIEKITNIFREHGITWDVWIMPVGADLEGQEMTATLVAEKAIERGYKVSIRAHVYLFGNVIGK